MNYIGVAYARNFMPNRTHHTHKFQHSTGSVIPTCSLYKQGTYRSYSGYCKFCSPYVFLSHPHSLVPDPEAICAGVGRVWEWDYPHWP